MSIQNDKPAAVVVNDDTTQLGILAGLLAKAGVEARAFESAEAALAAMDPVDPPDLVVTDLYMPDIDGWRFCRLLRSPEYAAFNEAPILVVSATFAGDHPERIAVDTGADAFLPSPVDGEDFVAQARALLAGKETRRLLRVLIVEDNKDMAELLRKTFASHGYQADTALTSCEAEAAFAKTPYDVAVLDYLLPDGTGAALLDAFRAGRPDCVCVMVTGDSSPELALDWMKRGGAAYLRKPFDPQLLIELCARARRERALLRAEDLLDARTRKLRESEERYRSLFLATPDGVWVHGADGVILDANETICRRTGLSRDALVGRNIREFLPPEKAAGVNKNVQDVLDGRPLVFDTTHFSATGTPVEVEIHEQRITWGDFPAVLSVSRDITERRSMEAQLRQAQKLESIGTLAGGVAHEINNPIMGIMNYAQLILDKLGPDSEVAEFATEIGHETERVATIVKNLLSFARQEKEGISPARLCDIVECTLSLTAALLRHDQIALAVDVPEDLPKIQCRGQQIQQVIMNLLTNARDALNEKYTGFHENKTTTITAHALDKAGQEWVRTTIEDLGPGISYDVRERMFEPFYTTKPLDTGTGLGLSISHGIVGDHGGELSVESATGEWTRFHVDLPAHNN